jgi:hypothetical protein
LSLFIEWKRKRKRMKGTNDVTGYTEDVYTQ